MLVGWMMPLTAPTAGNPNDINPNDINKLSLIRMFVRLGTLQVSI
jgi:hypothetical protein